MVHALAEVPVVKLPVASLALAFITGAPVPQVEIVGVAPVLEAVKCPYWSTSNSLIAEVREGEVVAATVKIEPVVEAVAVFNTCVPYPSWIENAFADVVAIVKKLVPTRVFIPAPIFPNADTIKEVMGLPGGVTVSPPDTLKLPPLSKLKLPF